MDVVIRNVCIHTAGEQPLLCDLFAIPSANDAGLLCTNVRSMDGKRPVFIDQIGSTFFFPYHVVRFLEIPEQSMAAYRAGGGRSPGVASSNGSEPDLYDPGDDVPGGGPVGDGDASLLPIAVGPPAEPGVDQDVDPDLDIEIDEDFLKRVRDI